MLFSLRRLYRNRKGESMEKALAILQNHTLSCVGLGAEGTDARMRMVTCVPCPSVLSMDRPKASP